MDVSRKDRDQQADHSPGGEVEELRYQKQNSQRYFKKAAYINKQQVPGQIRWHHSEVESGIEEMIDSRQHEEDRQ